MRRAAPLVITTLSKELHVERLRGVHERQAAATCFYVVQHESRKRSVRNSFQGAPLSDLRITSSLVLHARACNVVIQPSTLSFPDATGFYTMGPRKAWATSAAARHVGSSAVS